MPSSSASSAGSVEKKQPATGVRVCPSCRSHDVRRSHRKGLLENLLRLVLLRPFRCKNCGRRYYGYALHPRDRHRPHEFDEEPSVESVVAPEKGPPRRPRGAVAGLTCPQCGSVNVHRSRRRERWERLNHMRLVRRFRCHDCNAPIHAFMPRVWLNRLRQPSGAASGEKD